MYSFAVRQGGGNKCIYKCQPHELVNISAIFLLLPEANIHILRTQMHLYFLYTYVLCVQWTTDICNNKVKKTKLNNGKKLNIK